MHLGFPTFVLAALAPPTLPTSPDAPALTSSVHLDPLLEAVATALDTCDVDAKDRDGTWCFSANQDLVSDAMAGLRGRKKAWWIDSPRPLRAVVSRGKRHEIAVVALPGGTELPAASFPAGSLLFCRPLLGQVEVRRVRADGAGVLETMRKTITPAEPAALALGGGPCHEFRGAPGVASAYLQVVLLPPTARLPDAINVDVSGSIGWRAPPAVGAPSPADDLVCGAVIGASLGDLIQIERPSSGELQWENEQNAAPPDDAPQLLARLSTQVGGLDGPLSVIVRRALASRMYPPAITRELGVNPVCTKGFTPQSLPPRL